MSLQREDLERWRALGWWGRFQKRRAYQGRSYSWAYRNVEPEEYPFWVLSNCTYYIVSGAGSLLPNIMLTPVADRDRVWESRKKGLETILERIRSNEERTAEAGRSGAEVAGAVHGQEPENPSEP